MLHESTELPIVCGMQSLIGTGRERPCSWGNYFWLSGGERVLNMWLENLEAADEKFKLNGMVQVRKYTSGGRSWVLIDDHRIHSDWYYNKLCFTGGYAPPLDVLRDMYEYLGDPTNELEQFTDPVSYYAKRGGEYKNGLIIYRRTAPSRTLSGTWTCGPAETISMHGLDAEEEIERALMEEINAASKS